MVNGQVQLRLGSSNAISWCPTLLNRLPDAGTPTLQRPLTAIINAAPYWERCDPVVGLKNRRREGGKAGSRMMFYPLGPSIRRWRWNSKSVYLWVRNLKNNSEGRGFASNKIHSTNALGNRPAFSCILPMSLVLSIFKMLYRRGCFDIRLVWRHQSTHIDGPPYIRQLDWRPSFSAIHKTYVISRLHKKVWLYSTCSLGFQADPTFHVGSYMG